MGCGASTNRVMDDSQSQDSRDNLGGQPHPRHKSFFARLSTHHVKKHAGFHRKEFPDEIPFEDIHFESQVGQGSFGVVFSGYVYGQKVALKKLKANVAYDDEALADFKSEVEIVRKLRHPNIINFMGACLQNPNYIIVTDFIEGGSLKQLIRNHKLSRRKYLHIALGIAHGVNWLHHKNIIHRDLKPSNILVDHHDDVKICDFGLSHVKKHVGETPSLYGVAGTPTYMAPEVLDDRPYNKSADIFSMAIIFVEMLINKYPYSKDIYDASSGTFETIIIAGERPTIPEDTEKHLIGLPDLIRCMWEPKPSARPTGDIIIRQLNEVSKRRQAAATDILEDLPPDVLKVLRDDLLRIHELELKTDQLRTVIGSRDNTIDQLNTIIRRFRKAEAKTKARLAVGDLKFVKDSLEDEDDDDEDDDGLTPPNHQEPLSRTMSQLEAEKVPDILAVKLAASRQSLSQQPGSSSKQTTTTTAVNDVAKQPLQQGSGVLHTPSTKVAGDAGGATTSDNPVTGAQEVVPPKFNSVTTYAAM